MFSTIVILDISFDRLSREQGKLVFHLPIATIFNERLEITRATKVRGFHSSYPVTIVMPTGW